MNTLLSANFLILYHQKSFKTIFVDLSWS